MRTYNLPRNVIQNTGRSSVFERCELLHALVCAASGIGITAISLSETWKPVTKTVIHTYALSIKPLEITYF